MNRQIRFSTSMMAIASALAWATPTAWADGLDNLLGDNAYVSVFGGANIARGHAAYFSSVYDILQRSGFSVGIATGNHIGNGFRLEREISFTRNANKSTGPRNVDLSGNYAPMTGETSTLFMFTNLWKDIDLGLLRPYVGGGVGVGTHWMTASYPLNNGYDGSGSGLAAQLGAGVRYAVSDRLAIDAGYRLRTIADISLDGSALYRDHNAQASNTMHTFQLGASYSLNGNAMPDNGNGEGNWYVSLFGGSSLAGDGALQAASTVLSLERDTGLALGAAVGTDMADGLRAELELSYLRNKISSYSYAAGYSGIANETLKSGFVLGNVWKDFHVGGVSPYIGGGIGFGLAQVESPAFSDRPGLSIAGQFGAGARIPVSDNMAVDVGYRFKATMDAPVLGHSTDFFTQHSEVSASEHVLQIGLTYGDGGVQAALAAGIADTPDSHYVSLFGGLAVPLDAHVATGGYSYAYNDLYDFKNGFVVGAAFGGDITPSLRGEMEASLVSYGVKTYNDAGIVIAATGKVDSYWLLANLWRDMELGMFHPYFGGGVGLAYMDMNLDNYHVDETLALGVQIGSGVRVPLTDSLSLDAGYRFKGALGVLTEGVPGSGNFHGMGTYYTHVGQLGVSWKF